MRFISLLFLSLLSHSHVILAKNASPELSESLQSVDAYVYQCHDGDTCRVRVAQGLWFNVRLAGIDAPEVGRGKKHPGQSLGPEARDALNQLIAGKAVKLRQVDLDRYNRPVVEVMLAGGVINQVLLEGGWAEVYRGATKRLDKTPYIAAEERAKKAKKGIWALPAYVSPASFRKMTH